MQEINLNEIQREDFAKEDFEKIEESIVGFADCKVKVSEMSNVCILCGKAGVIFFKGEYLCLNCIDDIKNCEDGCREDIF